MIGWVPHVMVSFFDQVAGIEMRKAILLESGLDPEASLFRIDSDLPDPACRRIIDSACIRLGVTENQAFELFAPYFLSHARVAFPGFFRDVSGTRAFLLRQPAIHNCLASGLLDAQRQAVADKFRVEPTTDGLRVYYHSSNRLAGLYVAMAREMAAHYGEAVRITFETGGPDSERCTMHIEVIRLLAEDFEYVRLSA